MDRYSKLKTILLDMDGVLWHGSEPVLDIQLLFNQIQDLGLQAFCVTNNSTRTVSYHLDTLRGFGVPLDPSQIITSAEATAAYLAGVLPEGSSVFVIGESGLKSALQHKGFKLLDEETDNAVQAVVVGLDRKFTYHDIDLAARFIHRGAMFIGTNPDLTFPTPTGESPGAGTIIKSVEASSGTKPLIIGKPYSPLFSLALARAQSRPFETLMIGDRLETDILGAQDLGLVTALVLTGISQRDQAASWDPKPDIIADDAIQVIDRIRNSHG